MVIYRLAQTRATQRGGSDRLYPIRQGEQKVKFRRYSDKTFTSSIWRNIRASQQALGLPLIIVVIAVLLLSRSGGRLRWRR